jgi:CheY-like chemotaxis protein
VSLPLTWVGESAAASGAERSADAPVVAPDLRILVAEDNAVNQLVIRTLLAQAGVTPMIVDDGLQAVAAWSGSDWDLVLMDVQMPNMDGPTAAREIRRLEAAAARRRTPILALTANAMSHQVSEYMASGMDGHVAKPISVAELLAKMEAALAAAESAAEKAA